MISRQFSDPAVLTGLKLHPAIERGLKDSDDKRSFMSPVAYYGQPFRFVHPGALDRFMVHDRLGADKVSDFLHGVEPEEHIQNLMDSMRSEGLQDPMHLKYFMGSHRGELMEGHHRLIAAHRLGLSSVPVVGHVSDSTSSRGALITPIQSVRPDTFGWFPKSVDPQQIING